MTLNDLENEVICLGFESGIDNPSLLITCANRALKILFRELVEVERKRLYKRANTPIAYADVINGNDGEVISLYGKAYSFRISGVGSYTVTDRNGRKRTENFDGENLLYRGFSDGGEIIFNSPYPFTVLNFSCFSQLNSPNESDIREYSKYEKYELDKLFTDFLSLAEEPTDSQGRAIRGSLTDGAVLLIPQEYSGEINVKYERAPREITLNDSDREIDVSKEKIPLLPLLTAAFLWLDDDWDKSQYYLSLYKDTLLTVRRAGAREIGSKYTTNGWA